MDNQTRPDEYDVDFDDTSQFAAWRYKDIVTLISETLSEEDQMVVQEHRSWQDVSAEIRGKLTDTGSSPAMRKLMSAIQPLPRSMATLNGSFISSVTPHDVQFNVLWGLVHLNLKLSYGSGVKLARTVEWLGRLRKVVELFNRCLDACEDLNEPRLAIVEIYDHTLCMLGESLQYLRANATDAEATKAWPAMNAQLVSHLQDLDSTVRHVNDITSYSAVNLDRQVKNMSLRHAPNPETEEHTAFPCTILPYQQNENFYGRSPELAKIIDYLTPSNGHDLKTYTIYGRRGVGKTEIALQYAHDNPSRFDAIFWIQCETSVSLRQSFTDVAVALNLPGADRNGHHDENHLAVQKWLKLTRKRWLFIFDNAERESMLRGYWPVGAKGSILITSRKYYNFMKDANRRGDTVRPFNPQQSYELLMRLLGEKWQHAERRGFLPRSEINAAKTLLSKIGGLALAIQQAAVLINNPEIGGSTIGGALELFNSNSRRLPERPVGEERSEMIHSLDTLWNMSFSALTPSARDFLSVLAMLSPDKMLIDLFLPRKQSVLNGKLSFIKQHQRTLDDRSNLTNVIQPPKSLEEVIDELLRKELIKRDGGIISVHVEVQEAMNYHSIKDLQDSFDAAVSLVYEAFPKACAGDSLHGQSSTRSLEKQADLGKLKGAACQAYINHGAHIGQKYLEYIGSGSRASVKRLKPSDTFTALMANCAWYLYEIGDYDTCLDLVKTAGDACEDKSGPRYANIANTAGCCYFDLNRLEKCRENYEVALQVQQSQYADDDLKEAIIYHNMGNLETSQGRYEEAMDFFNKAVQIRSSIGDTAAGQLALSYMCISRLYYFQEKYDDALKALATAETLFVRKSGAETHFMAFVHYSYGNIEFALNHLRAAKRSYTDALKIALAETPIHAITAAIYYRLGCVEFAMKHEEVARGHLEKAKVIAQLRSPSRDDGTIARILWKLSKVLESDILAGNESEVLRTRAELARRVVIDRGEGEDRTKVSDVVVLDEEGNIDMVEEEDSFDALVPIFYR